MSFIGDGGGNNGNGRNNNPMDDWLPDPSDKPESESDQLTRKQRADARLPINFEKGQNDEEFDDEENFDSDSASDTPTSSSALERIQSGVPSQSLDGPNPYLQVVSSLSPSEIISRFTLTAHPRVQEAAKTTILGLIGTLPKMAFETKVVTTGAKLASLMFQLQMTGYMFKNAEYRMALTKEFGSTNGAAGFLLAGSSDNQDESEDVKSIKGKIKVDYNPVSGNKDDSGENNPFALEVDASAFTSELRSEVSRLKEELSAIRSAKDEVIRKDLLTYIRTLPPMELQKLTNTMSDDVLTAMKGLVGAVMAGIDADASEDDSMDNDNEGLSPDTVMEQSGEAMAQLCMWQLVVGYNLRELEVREEMKESLLLGGNSDVPGSDEGFDNNDGDFSPGLQPGGME